MPPDQGEVVLDHQAIAGLEIPEQNFMWPEADLQLFFIGNWLEPDLGGQFIAEPEVVENQIDVDMEEWEAGEEDEEMITWTHFGLL